VVIALVSRMAARNREPTGRYRRGVARLVLIPTIYSPLPFATRS